MADGVERRGAPGLRTPRSVRVLFLTALALVLVNSSSLFFLTEQTDRFFAWTVAPPLTAAFFGASSFGAAALLYLSARQTWWVQARLGLVSPFVFLFALEVVTLVHLDRFHLDSPVLTARIAGWTWLAFYTVVPLWMLAVAILILCRRIGDPPPSRPIPGWFRAILVSQGVLVGVAGCLLVFATATTADLWPWALSPLTARAVGCWLLANAVLVLHAAVENDLDRMVPAAVTVIVSATLQGVAILRYGGDFEEASAGGVAYLAFVASLLLLGVATLLLRRPPAPATGRTA